MSNEDQYTRVYVGGLNEDIKKEDLQAQFEKFGKLNKVWIAFNPPGFAFIEYLNVDEAEMACNNMNGTEVMGAKLRVEISRGRGRGGRGGFRGRGRGFAPRGGYDRDGGGGYSRGGRSSSYGRPYDQGYGSYNRNDYGQGGYGRDTGYEDAGPPKYQSRGPPGPRRY